MKTYFIILLGALGMAGCSNTALYVAPLRALNGELLATTDTAAKEAGTWLASTCRPPEPKIMFKHTSAELTAMGVV
jgi:hypothetical protein